MNFIKTIRFTSRFAVGGLRNTQIVRENGIRSFNRYYSSVKDEYQKKIAEQIKESPVVLYMKGTPERPMCGFSNTVIRILEAEGATFKSHNVLDDDDLRQNIKDFSNWQTIPQVYIKGEFVGGADIMLSLYKSGDLTKMLEEAGVVEKQ